MNEYYRSSTGFTCHLFRQPVEFLANSRELVWTKSSTGWYIRGVKPEIRVIPNYIRTLLSRFWHHQVEIPESLTYLVKGDIRGRISFETLHRKLKQKYRYTIDIAKLLGLILKKNLKFFLDLNKECMPKVVEIQLNREALLSLYSSTEINLQLSARFFRRLEWLETYRATFDSVALGLQLIQRFQPILAVHRRTLERLKLCIVDNVEHTVVALKELAKNCRSWYFGGERPQGEFKSLVEGFSKLNAFRFSYINRAQASPPLKTLDSKILKGLEMRLTSQPVLEPDDWRDFLRRFFIKNMPTNPTFHTDPSTSGCIEHPRKMGGHIRSYCDLLLYRHGEELTENPKKQEGGLTNLKARNIFMLNANVRNETVIDNKGLVAGAKAMLRKLDYIPLVPVLCPEKGWKCRIPTLTVTAANLLMQPLRKLVDTILRRDPRIGESLGGVAFPQLNPNGLVRSQDLTWATDTHSFWIPESIYSVLLEFFPQYPELQELKEFFPKFFGPRKLLPASYLSPQSRLIPPKAMIHVMDINPCWNPKMEKLYIRAGLLPFKESPQQIPVEEESQTEAHRKTRAYEPMVEAMQNYYKLFENFIKSLNELNGVITTIGSAMGDPTSWAGLPLVSLYCAEKAGINSIKTCGDDSLMTNLSRTQNRVYNEHLIKMGVKISLKADYLHPTKGLFTEIPHVYGKPKRYTLLSLYTCPPGGSKGTLDWFNQPNNARLSNPEVDLSRYSKLQPEWLAAMFLGLPLGAPNFYGGINHQKFPRFPRFNCRQWLDYNASRTLQDLFMSRGLSIVPSAKFGTNWDQLVWRAAEVAMENFDPSLPSIPLSEFIQGLQNPASIRNLFLGKGPEVPEHTPKISVAVDRFNRKVFSVKSSGKHGRFENILIDHLKKLDRRVNPIEFLQASLVRDFGLGRGPAPKLEFTSVWEAHTGPK